MVATGVPLDREPGRLEILDRQTTRSVRRYVIDVFDRGSAEAVFVGAGGEEPMRALW